MNVRRASFRDVGRIEQLFSQAMEGEVTATPLSDESPVPQSRALLRLWYAVGRTLTSLVPLSDTGDNIYVAEHPREGVVGFIQAESVPGRPKAWQIVNVCTAPTPTGQLAAVELLTGLCRFGQEADVRRFFVRIPDEHRLTSTFLERGFTQYATEQILFAEQPHPAASAAPLRLARRDDIGALYLLYLRTTPAHVASLEGFSRKAWEAAFAGGAIARLGRDDTRHLVHTRTGLTGWSAVRPGTAVRPTILHLMCEAQSPEEREEFVDAVLASLPPGPTSSVLRHYDSELIRSLQARGFAVFGLQILLAYDLAARVRVRNPGRSTRKKPVLVPAGLVRSVPTDPTALSRFHVLTTAAVSGHGRSEKSSPR